MVTREEELSLKEILEIINNDGYQSISPFLLKILKESRKKNISNVELYNLEGEIATKIIKLEKGISFFKKTADRRAKNKEWFSREVYKAQKRAVKQVMDGVAWRLLNFDRGRLRQIAEHPQTGHLTEGFLQELEKGGQIVNSSDFFVILNDLTNCLRQGDLTIVSKDRIFIDEVKTKGSSKGNQKKSLDLLLKRLNEKKLSIGNAEAELWEIEGFPHNFLVEAEQIIKQSKLKGVFARRVAPYLWIHCLYVPKLKETAIAKLPLPIHIDCPFPDDGISTFSNLTLFDIFSPNIIPYSILPFREEDIADIITGKLQIKAVLSEKELIKSAKGKGWNLTFPTRKQIVNIYDTAKNREELKNMIRDVSTYVTFSKGSFEYKIGREHLFRICSEFLSIKALLMTAESIMNSASYPSRHAISVNFKEEYRIWR